MLALGMLTMMVADVQPKCEAVREGHRLELRSPAFRFVLDTRDGLRAVGWENRLTGRKLELGKNPELAVELDSTVQRIQITGWRCWRFENDSTEYAAPHFDDSSWQGRRTPIPIHPDPGNEWARTHVFIPAGAKGKRVALTIGSFGVYDFRHTRVFVNGTEIGARHAPKTWNEPAEFVLDPKLLRFGQDNVIALASTGEVVRTRRLDQVDPLHARSLAQKFSYIEFYEQYLTIGTSLTTPKLRVTGVRTSPGRAIITLRSVRPALEAAVEYRWNASEPVLRRTATIRNASPEAVRLMNLHLGTYSTGAPVSDGDLGFPVYVDGQFFVGLCHPAGWVTGQDGTVRLRQYPGTQIEPDHSFTSMEAVLGVAKAGAARQAFLKHLTARMRRVVRHHDKPYAIFESLASYPGGDFFGITEDHCLKLIGQLAAFKRDTGCSYDVFGIEFWHDSGGDLVRTDAKRFPNGFSKINAALAPLGTSLGLWYDTCSSSWNIYKNPVVHDCLDYDPAYGTIDPEYYCRAAEPLKSMYSEALARHTRDNKVRLFKFDGMTSVCYAPNHGHLPGLYSIEPIQNAAIENMRAVDRARPEAFMMLYWGSRSPWWLLWADTIWDTGLQMEAASPAHSPTLYVRDSVTVGLDQAQEWCEDIPSLGKESLGVWLSDWGWNSSIGKERWQEGFVMDICRGSLLAQPWSENGNLTQAEHRQMADFIALLRERPSCFRNPRLILGDPWRSEPYGYCCTNGNRAFLALNNCTWNDLSVPLDPNWGLPKGKLALYRWYPNPSRLTDPQTPILLRPFEVALFEAVREGDRPSLARNFEQQLSPARFEEPSQELPLTVTDGDSSQASPLPVDADAATASRKRILRIDCDIPACKSAAMLCVSVELRRDGKAVPLANTGRYFAASATAGGHPAALEPVVREWTYPCPWQAWRVPVGSSIAPRSLHLNVTFAAPAGTTPVCRGYFVPE